MQGYCSCCDRMVTQLIKTPGCVSTHCCVRCGTPIYDMNTIAESFTPEQKQAIIEKIRQDTEEALLLNSKPGPLGPPDRPSWTDYFIGMAFVASRRSHDIHTKHGCVLVDNLNHVVGVGYNGFPRGMNDDELPTTRPEKYDWMEHSEVNAVANATCVLTSIPGGPTAYITGQPCFPCLKTLWRHGCKKAVIANRDGYSQASKKSDEDQLPNQERFMRDTGFEMIRVTPDLNWLFDQGFMRELRGLGFIR